VRYRNEGIEYEDLVLRPSVITAVKAKPHREPAQHRRSKPAPNHPWREGHDECVEVIETWKELLQTVREIRGKQWQNGHMFLLEPLHRGWTWGEQKRNFLFLSTPRLVFNLPVLKDDLQEGKGWLK